jgi:hypothetical protein
VAEQGWAVLDGAAPLDGAALQLDGAALQLDGAALQLDGAALQLDGAALQLDEVCAARLAILEEQDPRVGGAGRDRAGSAGPFLGLVGPLVTAQDPRRAALYVTTLEDLARCPWRAFLLDVLRLGAPPDPRAALPAIDGGVRG